ncbi:MAG: hypothetical protein MZW92_37505 [Comamonadaceae bacterium]|nr:hypothetical protein [Comamonadaceae bacterium]
MDNLTPADVSQALGLPVISFDATPADLYTTLRHIHSRRITTTSRPPGGEETMKMRLMLTAVLISLTLTTLAEAASFDLGARYERTIQENGGTAKVTARYFPIPLVDLGASLGYGIEYDKKWYYKESDTMALGGYLNGHLPLPFSKPYVSIRQYLRQQLDTDSGNPAG